MYKRALVSKSYRVTARASSPDGIEFVNNDSMEVLMLSFIFLYLMHQKNERMSTLPCCGLILSNAQFTIEEPSAKIRIFLP